MNKGRGMVWKEYGPGRCPTCIESTRAHPFVGYSKDMRKGDYNAISQEQPFSSFIANVTRDSYILYTRGPLPTPFAA